MKQWKVCLAALAVAAGLGLFAAVIVWGDGMPGHMAGLCTGMGGALLGAGSAKLLIPLLMRSMTPEERQEVERGERDERNVAIREKAAYTSWYWTLGLLWIPFVVALLQGSTLWLCLSSGAVVLHSLFYLVNLARWARRM